MQSRAFVVCGATFFTGCSLVLAGDLDEAREIVIAPDASDSGASVGADGNVAETSVSDGGAEAGPAAPKGCAAYQPTPKFCTDFDDASPLDGWTSKKETGNPVIQSTESFSAPSALQVKTAQKDGECFYTRLDRTFAHVGSKRATVSVRMRLESPWPDAMTPLVFEVFPDGTEDQYCAALLYVDQKEGKPNGVRVNMQSGAMPNHLEEFKGFPSAGDWTEIKMEMMPLTSGGATLALTITDPDGLTVTSSHDFPECPSWTNIGIHPGQHCDTRAATMYFDDLRVDWE